MKYNITIHREIVGKYWNHKEVKDDSEIKTIHHDEYSDLSFEILKDILIGEIDPPEKLEKMTEEYVRDNFDNHRCRKLSDESINSIMTYYNSRLEMYNQIMKEVHDENFKYISVPLTKDNDTLDIYNNYKNDDVYLNSYITVKRV